MPRAPFAHSIYYLRRKREAAARGKYWLVSFHDSDGSLLLQAHFPEIPGQVIVFEPGNPESPLVRLKAWRWFWWNGRYDVVEAGTGTVLATLRRTGGIEGRDRRRIGRVRNAMPLRKSALQLFFIGIVNLIVSQGDSSAVAVDEFRVEAAGSEIGRLRRVRLPFATQSVPAETVQRGRLQRWLHRFRSALRSGLDSGGWQLDFSADQTGILDPRVRLAAALLHIQIEERYN